MIKKLLSLLFSSSVILSIYAQYQFENPSFENWEAITFGSIPEPVDWSSLRTAEPENIAQLAPAVWNVSDDAHTGIHSLYLTNIEIFGIVATGMVTTGRVLANLNTDLANSHTVPDDPRWNLPITHRPDSLVGWYKSKPSPNDFPTAKVLLHKGYAALPQADSSNWIGVAFIELPSNEVDVWTRFSTPFEYFNDEVPEFALTILTSGYGTFAVDGSEAWFDDMELIYNQSFVDDISANDLHVYSRNGDLNIFINENSQIDAQLFVTDLAGRQVYFNNQVATGQNHQYKLEVQNGIYLVTVQIENKRFTKKIWIQ